MLAKVLKICISFLIFGIVFHYTSSETKEVALSSSNSDLMEFAEKMSKYSIQYGQSWRPPGEDSEWIMDCSNTTRLTYQEVFQIKLPRSSYDQFFHAKKQNTLHLIELNENQDKTIEFIKANLKPGDVLFWQNTYNVNKNPPISHTMIYLGTDSSDKMFMFGASTFGKSKNSSKNGGIGIYPFHPYQKIGCVKDVLGECAIPSRFLGWAHWETH